MNKTKRQFNDLIICNSCPIRIKCLAVFFYESLLFRAINCDNAAGIIEKYIILKIKKNHFLVNTTICWQHH